MVHNPDGMNRFLKALLKLRDEDNTVFVDLSGVEELTFDAIAVLLARINETRFRMGGVRGNEPADPALRQMLITSGFYGHIRRRGGLDDGQEQRGEMIKESGLKAIGVIAQQLIRRATRSDKPHAEVYRILLDSMNNTFDHATPPELQRLGHAHVHWWASAYHDPVRGVGYFAFVDNGVGILKSLALRGVRLVARKLNLHSDAALLEAVFEGKIGSRTELTNRGHGLPGIQGVADRGSVRNVVVITNAVAADISAKKYRNLRVPFDGTLLTWEVKLP